MVTGDSQEEVLIFRYKQTDRQTLHHNIYIIIISLNIIIIIIIKSSLNNIIIIVTMIVIMILITIYTSWTNLLTVPPPTNVAPHPVIVGDGLDNNVVRFLAITVSQTS